MSEQQADEVTDTSEPGESSEPKQDVDVVPGEITDDQLPEDLQPTEDNPLARHPEQTGDDDDRIGADREEEPETAPLTASDAEYGSGGSDDASR
jgi:hypothetical protein